MDWSTVSGFGLIWHQIGSALVVTIVLLRYDRRICLMAAHDLCNAFVGE